MLQDISHIAAAAALIFAAWQLWLSHQQAQTAFEDAMAKEYRDLVSKMPTKALFGEDLTDAEHTEAIDEFYHYFDLSNGQIFLRQINRVRPKTWKFWCDGIRSNLKRPAFKTTWENISCKAKGDFNELRLLIAQNYEIDPKSRKWKRLIGKNS
jgi:hypothetical protein